MKTSSAIAGFIINGRMISVTLSFDEFKQKIDHKLKAAAAVTGLVAVLIIVISDCRRTLFSLPINKAMGVSTTFLWVAFAYHP
jgi:hypothetical protein